MKTLITMALMTLALTTTALAGDLAGVYGIHLFFDEKEFVDVLTLTEGADGVQGLMQVPNDFDGNIQNVRVESTKLTFDLLVPKNSSRPEDLMFRYEATFFDDSHQQMTGFVTLVGDPSFVASFVGFRR